MWFYLYVRTKTRAHISRKLIGNSIISDTSCTKIILCGKSVENKCLDIVVVIDVFLYSAKTKILWIKVPFIYIENALERNTPLKI